MKILANEYIYMQDETSCHASTFVLNGDGSIFAVWFRGTAEGNDDVCIWGSRRENGKWDSPRRLTEDDGLPHWNPVVHKNADGSVTLFYKKGKPIAEWHTEFMTSYDGGRSFSAPRELVPGDVGGRGPVRNKVIRLSDGSLLAGASTEGGCWKCFSDRLTEPFGEWKRSVDIRIPPEDLRPDVPPEEKQRGLIQPTLWEDPAKPGHVTALMRSTEGYVYRADSSDFGVTWSPARKTAMKNNNSGIDADVLPDGRIVLACNPRGVPEGKIWGARSPLSLFISGDGGETFEKLTDIVTGDGKFAYPAVRCEGTRIHVTYTWNRKMIMYFCLDLEDR